MVRESQGEVSFSLRPGKVRDTCDSLGEIALL